MSGTPTAARRTLVLGTAWSAPAIVVSAAAPAMGASWPCPGCLTTAAATSSALNVSQSNFAGAGWSVVLNLIASASCQSQFPGLAVSLTSGSLSLGVPDASGTAADVWAMTFNTGVAAGTYTTLTSSSSISLTLSGLTPGPQPPPPPNSSTFTNLAGTGLLAVCLYGKVRFTPAGGSLTVNNVSICFTFCGQGSRTYKQLGNGSVTLSYGGATLCSTSPSVTCS